MKNTSESNEPRKSNEPISDGQLEKILDGLSSEEIKNVKEVLKMFALPTDTELYQVLRRLPVSDFEAVQTKYIRGKYFKDAIKHVKEVFAIEKDIRDLAINIELKLNKQDLSDKDLNSIRVALKRIMFMMWQKRENRDKFPENPEPRFKNYEDIEDKDIPKQFPKISKYIKDRTPKNRADALAEAHATGDRARQRMSTTRRKEFRNAFNRNHEYVLECFRDALVKKYALGRARLDRVVIDVYLSDFLTCDPVVKRKINAILPSLETKYSINRLPKHEDIEYLKLLGEEDENIDDLARQYEQLRNSGLVDGVYNKKRGILIKETDYYKAILTLEPKKTGAPVRLRLIVNIQMIILHELFKLHPEKKDIYKRHSWTGNSEINFIMPEDYDFYRNREQTVCDALERDAKALFLEQISEHLGIGVSNPFDIVVYASQWEACWEEEFEDRNATDPKYNTYPCPGLAEYLDNMAHIAYQSCGDYASFKCEKGTSRPTFNCNFLSMDPTVPMFQYKMYPKFRNSKNNIMLRHEIIAGSFFKQYGKDTPDSLPMSMKVLSNPRYCMEEAQRLLQLELYLNGMEGLGYNIRFHKPTENEKEEWLLQLIQEAIFGKKAEKYAPEFQVWVDTGKIPGTLPANYKKKFRALKLDGYHFKNMFREEGED